MSAEPLRKAVFFEVDGFRHHCRDAEIRYHSDGTTSVTPADDAVWEVFAVE